MQIKLALVPTWETVQTVLEKSSRFLTEKNTDADFISATSMCVSELIENAVKYGAKTPDNRDIEFDMTLDESTVQISVSNGVRNESDLEHVCGIIDRIQKSDDHAQLYVGRLRELMENPIPGSSQLGLYRIAYEGHFNIEYTYRDGVLSIIAHRSVIAPGASS